MNDDDVAVDKWRLDEFTELGFSEPEIACLLNWQTSPADARHLLWRAGRRTDCTHDQALRILQPLDAEILVAA